LKEKFDREGVNFISDESEIGRDGKVKPNDPSNLGPKNFDAPSVGKGHVSNYANNMNMAGSRRMDDNPLKSVIDQTNAMFSPKKNQ